MQFDVVRTFFLKGEEYVEVHKVDPYIVDDMPQYELEDGSIIYAHAGFDKHGAYRIWYGAMQKQSKIVTK